MRRTRVLIVIGAVAGLAAVVTFFAIFRVNLGGGPLIAFRDRPATHRATEYLLVTTGTPAIATSGASDAEQGYLATLAAYYARLANGDVMHRDTLSTREGGSYAAEPVVSGGPCPKRLPEPGSVGYPAAVIAGCAGGRSEMPPQPLPVVRITSTAAGSNTAIAIARRASRNLILYVDQLQAGPNRRPAQPHLEVLSQPEHADAVGGRNVTLPLVVLAVFVVLAAAGAAATRRQPAAHGG